MVRMDSDGYEYEYDLFDSLKDNGLYGIYTIIVPVKDDAEANKTLSNIDIAIYNDSSINLKGAYGGAGILSLENIKEFTKKLEAFMLNYQTII